MIPNYTAELELAKRLAENANTIAMKHYKTPLQFRTKDDKSPVTIADEEINQMVITTVANEYPADGVLGEEQSWQKKRRRIWVCDPIDGTTAFSIGLPTFMFSIALVDDGLPVVSVASNPVSGDIFWAISGKGAFMNGEQIHVSKHALREAWMLYPANFKSLCKKQEFYEHLQEDTYQTTIIHGSVYKGTLVAQGLADGMIHLETGHPWDFAAVDLLVREAGGRTTDATGGALRFDKELTSVISSNGIIHNQLLSLTKNYINVH